MVGNTFQIGKRGETMYVFAFKGMLNTQDSQESLPDIEKLPRGWNDPNQKEKVLAYMKSHQHQTAFNLRRGTHDMFTGKEIPVCGNSWKDSFGWVWTDENIYYVDCYDFIVPERFVADIEQAYQDGFIPEDDLISPWRRSEQELPQIIKAVLKKR